MLGSCRGAIGLTRRPGARRERLRYCRRSARQAGNQVGLGAAEGAPGPGRGLWRDGASPECFQSETCISECTHGVVMSWSDLLRRRPRIKTTSLGVAAALTETIVLSTNVLRSRLQDEGLSLSHPARFESDECLLECALFEWFLLEIALINEFGRHAEGIRRALGGRLLIDLQRSGISPASLKGFDQVSHERFAEYQDALEASSSLQALGHRAWLRISGTGEPSERMTMLLAIRARAELEKLRGIGREYTVSEKAVPTLRSVSGVGPEGLGADR